jgi:uncharacterized membrane protein YgaE (UPF0421/DUF939 family)
MTKLRFSSGVQHSVRAGAAAFLSVMVAQRMNQAFPIAALISSVIVTEVDPAQTRHLALRRLFGTIAGAAIGIVFGPSGAVGVGFGVAAAMLFAYAIGRSPAAKLTGYVCGVVVLSRTGNDFTTAYQRLLETAIGIGAAVIVSCIPPLHFPDTASSGDSTQAGNVSGQEDLT